ncbi:MAG: hypothetical protein ACKO34_08610 [Vampirovibrionales bacterium]
MAKPSSDHSTLPTTTPSPILLNTSPPVGIGLKTTVWIRYTTQVHDVLQLQATLQTLPPCKAVWVCSSSASLPELTEAVLGQAKLLIFPEALLQSPMLELWQHWQQQHPNSNSSLVNPSTASNAWGLFLEAGQCLSPSQWFELDSQFQSPPPHRVGASIRWQTALASEEITQGMLQPLPSLNQRLSSVLTAEKLPFQRLTSLSLQHEATPFALEGTGLWVLPSSLYQLQQEAWLRDVFRQASQKMTVASTLTSLQPPAGAKRWNPLAKTRAWLDSTLALSATPATESLCDASLLAFWEYVSQKATLGRN